MRASRHPCAASTLRHHGARSRHRDPRSERSGVMAGEHTSALLRSRLVQSPPRNAALSAAYERGEAATAPALPLFGGVAVPPAIRPKPFGALQRQMRSYDRAQSWGRKRQMGGDGKLPNNIRCWFTEGERAVLTVIAAEVKKRGDCRLSVLSIARRAGVGVRLVQYTLSLARGGRVRPARRDEPPSRPVLISVEYRRERGRAFNDTNVIEIVSREWLSWLRYRPSENPDTGCTEVRPISIRTLQPLSHSGKLHANGAVERSQGAGRMRERPAERASPS